MDEDKKETNCFFTVVSGEKYLRFAYTLARSYKYHNGIAIPFYIVADHDFVPPNDLLWVKKKIITSELMSKGVGFKLNFDKIAPAMQSIFIDADSIIYSNINKLFNLPNSSIQVIGMPITSGQWVEMNVTKALTDFDIKYLVRFAGSFYYIINNELTEKICDTARQLAATDYPFQHHGSVINDEPLFSISMAKQGIIPVKDDGRIWTDTVQLLSHNDLNTLDKKAVFNNSKEFRYKFWLPEGDYSPCIIHFGGGSFNKNPWLFDALRLKLFYQYHLPKLVSNFTVAAFIKPLYFMVKTLKRLFT